MLEFIITLQNVIECTDYLIIKIATFKDILAFQMDFQLKGTSNVFIQLRYWLYNYQSSTNSSINKGILCNSVLHTLYLMWFWCSKYALIITDIKENWNVSIIILVIKDYAHPVDTSLWSDLYNMTYHSLLFWFQFLVIKCLTGLRTT